MKKNFVFDVSETDLIDVEEATVIKETGVSSDRVKESVMKEIKKGKKKFSKKKLFSVIAIAAAIGLVSGLTVSATTGGFNPLFGELFAGQVADGVFPGSNITVESNDVNIDFVGIAGDNDAMLGIYEITRKDGSKFLEDPSDYVCLANAADIEVTNSLWSRLWSGVLFSGSPQNRGGQVRYQLIDENTIRAVVGFSDENEDIKGERMTIKEESITLCHIDEVLCECYTYEEYEAYRDAHEAELEEKEKGLREDQSLIKLDDQYVVGTFSEFPLTYELGVTLNYKSTEKNMENAKGSPFTALNTDWEVVAMSSKSLSMTLTAKSEQFRVYQDFDEAHMDNWTDGQRHLYLNADNEIVVDITLRDGTTVVGEGFMNEGAFYPNGKGTTTWKIIFHEKDSAMTYALNPNDIVSVKCNNFELLK